MNKVIIIIIIIAVIDPIINSTTVIDLIITNSIKIYIDIIIT